MLTAFSEYLVHLNIVFLFILIAFLLLIIGKSADILVDNSVAISLNWGVSKLVVGATIVSIGTTLPEASVSVMAAIAGNPDMALGNAIGSIICDTGLIIGVAAMIGKLPVDDMVINRQGKLQFAAVALLAVVALPFWSATTGGVITQWVGFLFIILLVLYVFFSIRWSKRDAMLELIKENTPAEIVNSENNVILLFKIALGAFGVIATSKFLIPTVAITAKKIGVPEGVIAATLVAFGTSLPELVTAINAVLKGHGELAVGNIVGADILNVLFVVGAAAAVSPQGLEVPINFYLLQIPAMLIIIFAFRIFSKSNHNQITKFQGLFLAAIYVVYLLLNFTIN